MTVTVIPELSRAVRLIVLLLAPMLAGAAPVHTGSSLPVVIESRTDIRDLHTDALPATASVLYLTLVNVAGWPEAGIIAALRAAVAVLAHCNIHIARAELLRTPLVPWQPWFFGRKGDPAKGFAWTYHMFWGLEDVIANFTNGWKSVATNKKVGGLFPNDGDGNAWGDKELGFPKPLSSMGFTLTDPGRFQNGTQDFSAQIAKFKADGVEIVTGVVIPPVGYLQRLREICTAHNILLIFDEVITGFGRAGAWTGAEAFGVTPDILNFAKQVTNGVQPLGGVVVKKDIYDTFMAAGGPDYMLEFPHGYTYSAHPVACAAGIASLELLAKENMVERVQALAPVFERAVHGLKGVKHVTDIRNFGFAGALTGRSPRTRCPWFRSLPPRPRACGPGSAHPSPPGARIPGHGI